MSKIGRGIGKQEVPGIIKNVLDKAEKDGLIEVDALKFRDNLPSLGWVYSFLKRHPELSARTTENLGFQRAHISETGIRKWFVDLETFLREEHSIEAREFFVDLNAHRIFNLDESGLAVMANFTITAKDK